MIIVQGPSTTNTKYGWLCILLEWTNITHHDLITHNLWPKPEITTRSKPNKSLKSPHKQLSEELNNQDKTENPPNITPQTTKTNKKATGTKQRSVKRNITHNKYVRNPENIPYYEGDTLNRRIYQQDRNTQQLN
jgi:hypothetical protein